MKNKKLKYLLIFILPILVWFYFCLPDPLFTKPYSVVLNDKDGKLLGATTASDQQWRFPVADSIPKKFERCILEFEDAHFYYHPGVNPVSLIKAFAQNLKAGKVVRGGSTLSMQVIRLSRQGQPRTYLEKLYECVLALRLELRYSKQEILALYAAHAPFGGNVVGLEAASWRYFKRPAHLLSWGETAALAVLPNAPSLIFPGKNQELLKEKRDLLINKLVMEEYLDNVDGDLAKSEPLPGKPQTLPQIAPHVLAYFQARNGNGALVESTIDSRLQQVTYSTVQGYYHLLRQNQIFNAATLVVETKTGAVRAYVGNTTDAGNSNENAVDIIRSARSSGSTLKPFLYRSMIQNGQLLPGTLLPDIPTYVSGYAPKNFNEQFDGAVYANAALARSLNVPAVRMLQNYGVEIFLEELKEMNFTTINRSSDDYGLTLILGGAEVTLWDLVENYRKMALDVMVFHENVVDPVSIHLQNDQAEPIAPDPDRAGASWLTLEALKVMDRPIEGADWRSFSSSKSIAWKTGTSFGHKDAWTVGVTPDYVVGVWVGNADGEGRPGLTGASTAAPLMFDIFRKLKGNDWFKAPESDLVSVETCVQSGYKATELCNNKVLISTVSKGLETPLCPYHKKVFLDEKERYRVSSDCYSVNEMVSKSWFVLPPIMEWYYASKNPYYQKLPHFKEDCLASSTNLDIIYPQPNAKLFIPRGFNGQKESLVFEAAYSTPGAQLYWHLDDQFLITTKINHQIQLQPDVGKHTLTVVTERGEVLYRKFEVVN
ncbi:MAG: penicillin-binding protein 1C [Bacteroidota bacterium]